MLVFTSFVLLFGAFHVAIERAKLYICTNMTITSDMMQEFRVDKFVYTQGFVEKLNTDEGDDDFKKCVKHIIYISLTHIFFF